MSLGLVVKPGEKYWPVTDFKGDPGRTVQADRDDADINKIVARFHKTGQLPPSREELFGDISEIGDFADALMRVQRGKELFMEYPAHIRERFQNDPAQLISFLDDESNLDEAVELGLVQKAPAPEPEPVVPPAAGAAEPK